MSVCSIVKPILMMESQKDNEEVKRLIDNEVLHHEFDESKNTLLHHAARLGNYEIVRYLVDSGSQVNAVNDFAQNPLIVSLKTDFLCKKVVKILLQAGADIHVADIYGHSALSIVNSSAWFNGDKKRFEILKIFLKRADFYYVSDANGITLIHMFAKTGKPDITALPLGKSFDVNVIDRNGWTPLMHAALSANVNAVEFLLDQGANTEAVDDQKRTALYLACARVTSKQTEACIQLLLEGGASAQMDRIWDPSTIFDLLWEKGNFKVAGLALAQLAYQEANGVVINQVVWSAIEFHSQFRTYFEQCKKHLLVEIHRKVTLIDVLNASEENLTLYLCDRQLASKLRNIKTIEYYNAILCKRLSKAFSDI